MHDITERKKAAEEIRVNSELLRELYNNSQNIREEERAYIAREIHDELGQQLTGLKMDIFWIKRKLNSEDPLMKEKITGTIELLDQTIKTVRKISTELRPSILDDLGLIAAMEWQSEEFGKRSGLIVNFSCNLDESNLKPESKITVFRIYQEILTNIARHAEATIVNTSVNIKNNQLFLSVDDNGNGFDVDTLIHKKTLGIKGIKERAKQIGGTYEIKSMTGNDTSVLVSIPVF